MSTDAVAAAIAKTAAPGVGADAGSIFVGTVAQVSPLRVDVAGVAGQCSKLSDVPALVGGDRVLVVRAVGQTAQYVCLGKVVST